MAAIEKIGATKFAKLPMVVTLWSVGPSLLGLVMVISGF